MTFSDDYQIISAPIVQIQIAGHGSEKTDKVDRKSNIPDQMIIPFRLANKLILVEAEIDGIKGNFLSTQK